MRSIVPRVASAPTTDHAGLVRGSGTARASASRRVSGARADPAAPWRQPLSSPEPPQIVGLCSGWSCEDQRLLAERLVAGIRWAERPPSRAGSIRTRQPVDADACTEGSEPRVDGRRNGQLDIAAMKREGHWDRIHASESQGKSFRAGWVLRHNWGDEHVRFL